MMHFPKIANWIEVTPPPPPYVYALRRSFPRGLHLLVLVMEMDGEFRVLSSADNGTPRGTTIVEGTSRNPGEIADFIRGACATIDEKEATHSATSDPDSGPAPVRYFYAADGGGIAGPANRDELFALATQGNLSWDSQVWEEILGMAEGGRWRPMMFVLGFPEKRWLLPL